MNSAIANDCPSGQYWISPHFRSGYTKYNGVVVRPTHVSGHCRTNPRGYEKWYQKLSNNRPKLWEYKTEISKKWAAEEVERVYNALELFPQELLNLDKVELYRMTKSVSPINPATTNYKDVVLYDVAFKHEVPMEQILAHELSHVLYDSLSKQLKYTFASAAGWEEMLNRPGTWTTKPKKVFIEKDSRVSIKEDFANHIEHYLFKNESLKKNSPTAYEWITKTYGLNFKLQEKK